MKGFVALINNNFFTNSKEGSYPSPALWYQLRSLSSTLAFLPTSEQFCQDQISSPLRICESKPELINDNSRYLTSPEKSNRDILITSTLYDNHRAEAEANLEKPKLF